MKSNKFILVLIAVAFIGCKREIVSPSSINNSSNENISADDKIQQICKNNVTAFN